MVFLKSITGRVYVYIIEVIQPEVLSSRITLKEHAQIKSFPVCIEVDTEITRRDVTHAIGHGYLVIAVNHSVAIDIFHQ